MNNYLDSDDFKTLSSILRFSDEDIDEIKHNVSDYTQKEIAILINEQYNKYNIPLTKDKVSDGRLYELFSDDKYLFQVYFRNPEKWEDIENKINAEIQSGKITSTYLLNKSFKSELDLISEDSYNDAFISLSINELKYLQGYSFSDIMKKEIIKALRLLDINPLFFGQFKEKFEETVNHISNEPSIKIKNFNGKAHSPYIIIDDERLVNYIDDIIIRSDNNYSDAHSDYLFGYLTSFRYSEMAFYAITGVIKENDKLYFKDRSNFSNVFIIKKRLIDEDLAIEIDINTNIVDEYDDLISEYLINPYEKFPELESKEYNDFKVSIFKNSKGNKKHLLSLFKNSKEDKKHFIFDSLTEYKKFADYNHHDLFEIVSQKPLSREFLKILSFLDFTIDEGYEIREASKSYEDVIYNLNKKILENKSETNQLQEYYIKSILHFKENDWTYIKSKLETKINSNDDLDFCFYSIVRVDELSQMKVNILYAQIEGLLKFRELNFNEYASELAFFIRESKDAYSLQLAKHLNKIIKSRCEKNQKPYLDEGKYWAPRWLVFPSLSATTIGWRMGYGEAYRMSVPFGDQEFYKLFPEPQNWLCERDETANGAKKLKKYSFFARFWRKDGIQKYNEITEDYIVVNDFITIDQIDKKFTLNAMTFLSIKNYILVAKYDLFDKREDSHDFTRYNNDFKIGLRGKKLWNHYKYSACLNGAYYKFMQDEHLKQRLLDTGDKSLVYISDDEWGGDENLFGFALMELRDEIRRLYKNEDLIDWEYTEYVIHNPARYM